MEFVSNEILRADGRNSFQLKFYAITAILVKPFTNIVVVTNGSKILEITVVVRAALSVNPHVSSSNQVSGSVDVDVLAKAWVFLITWMCTTSIPISTPNYQPLNALL